MHKYIYIYPANVYGVHSAWLLQAGPSDPEQIKE